MRVRRFSQAASHISIPEYEASCFEPSSLGKVFNYNKCIWDGENQLKHLKYTSTKGLLFRESTHNLIQHLQSNQDIVMLRGRRGCGKTATMLQTVQHFQKNNALVFHLNMFELVSGHYPYESQKDKMYAQPELASAIMQRFVDLNGSNLENVSSPENGTNLLKFCKNGIPDTRLSQNYFRSLMSHLFNSADRPTLLLAFDQLNAIFGPTNYFDRESKRLHADQFIIAKTLKDALLSPPNATKILISQDYSISQIKSKQLEYLEENAKSIYNDPMDVRAAQYKQPKVEGSISLLPGESYAENFSTFQSGPKIPNLKTFCVPSLTLPETEAVIEFYQTTQALKTETYSEKDLLSYWMVSQGNPHDLFKSATI